MNQTCASITEARAIGPARQYLNLIHPRDGRVFVGMSYGDKQWKQQPADSVDQALAIIYNYEAQKPAGVFISQATFDSMAQKRGAQSAKEVSCVFLDFDVGSGAGKLATKAEALAAIRKLEIEFLPCSAIVDSGGGYHAYWCLTTPIDAKAWLTIARRLKHALQVAGVRADPTVTADLARVLRVPGTVNRKTSTARPCDFLEHASDRQYSVEEINTALSKYEALHRASDTPKSLLRASAHATLSIPGTPPAAWQGAPLLLIDQQLPPAPSPQDVELACPAIQALAFDGGQSEEAWSLGIVNTAAFTSDPDAAAQAWSANYGGYQAEEVAEKLATKLAANKAPTSCERMAALGPECASACNACGYQGKVTNPIHAGQKRAAAQRNITAQASVAMPLPQPTTAAMPDFGYTETGNAQRMHHVLGANIAYVHEQNNWLHFQDGKWNQVTHVQLVALATAVVQQLYGQAASMSNTHEAKALAAHATKSLSNNWLNNTVSLLKAQPGVEIRVARLNINDMQLGTRDGLLVDLRTGQVRAQRPDDYITMAVGCGYDPLATCPTWVAFLESLFCGGAGAADPDDDQGRIHYLQLWVGYALTGLTTEQQFQFAHGVGANGKSVLYGLLKELFGSYCLQSQPEAFMLKPSGEGATPLLARLQGVRLVIAPETEDGQRLAESTVKQLTGGDTMVARPMYGHPFEFQPKFKLAIVGNHKPVIRGDDHGIWRRVHLLPFSRIFEPHEQDRNLPEKLRQELPGILNWAIQGCLMWQRAGRLKLPEIMLREAQEYRSEMDLIAQWLIDLCDVGPGLATTGTNAYASFQNWCKQNGSAPFSNRRFSQKLVERGFIKTRTNTARGWDGFTCRQSVFAGLI
jgi:P4 family phage/plasmid primase-like protien